MEYKDIIGHERQIESLKNTIKKESISHSYLFEGEEGLGKKGVALVFAKSLLCRKEGEEPCNECPSCIKFDGGNHPDFKLISPEKDMIRKDEIDSLVKSASTIPFEGKRKVFIIDDSHEMNQEAMNGLLKTLEEPPDFMNMILISSASNKLLPTILSRCQRIGFYPVEIWKIVDLLAKDTSLSKDRAEFIANFTKGSVGKSIEISKNDDFFEKRDQVIKIINELLKGDKTKAFSSLPFFNSNKDTIDDIFDIMIYWFRDLLIYKEVGKSDLIINKDKFEILSGQSSIDYNRINGIMNKIENTRRNIYNNVNFALSIETMLLNI